MKTCSRCYVEKEDSLFGKSSVKDDGLQSYCIECMREYRNSKTKRKAIGWERKTADISAYQKEYRAAHREKMNEQQNEWRKAHPGFSREKERKRYERKMKAMHGEEYVVGASENKHGIGFGRGVRLTNAEITNHAKVKQIVRSAIRNGTLTRLPCCVCGDEKVEGHHPDYDSPLDVVWLCRSHHMQLHREFDEYYPPGLKGGGQ